MSASSGSSRPRKSSSKATFLPRYLLFLFVAQAAYAFCYVHFPWLRVHYVVQILIRLAIWTLPVVVHLVLRGKNVLNYLKLSTNVVRGIVAGLAVGCFLVLLNLAANLVQHGHVAVNVRFGADLWWKSVITVGLSEEVAFRGYLLREWSSRMNFWFANLVQALAFLLIHVPGWILLKQFIFPGVLHSAAYVFFFAVVLGYILKRTNSLWGCMIAHSFSNFCTFAIS